MPRRFYRGMNDRPVPSFDPERLKRERHDADLGAEDETGFEHVDDTAPDRERRNEPAPGATPPPH